MPLGQFIVALNWIGVVALSVGAIVAAAALTVRSFYLIRVYIKKLGGGK